MSHLTKVVAIGMIGLLLQPIVTTDAGKNERWAENVPQHHLRIETANVETANVETANMETAVETIVGVETVIKPKKIKKYTDIKKVCQKIQKATIKLQVNKTCGLSKKDFVKLIGKLQKMEYNHDANKIFANYAEYIWQLGEKNHVDAIFVCGIIAQESKWGKSQLAVSTNNFTSQSKPDGKLIRYDSIKECLDYTFKNLSQNYLVKGRKYYNGLSIEAVGKEYCVGKWDKEVLACMKIICGNE